VAQAWRLLQASQLQLAVILLSIVCAALASTAAVYACILVAVDQQHMLRGDRLLLRHGREAGVAHWIHSQSIKVLLYLVKCCSMYCSACRVAEATPEETRRYSRHNDERLCAL